LVGEVVLVKNVVVDADVDRWDFADHERTHETLEII
jgi:hypothetical protein